MRSSLLPAGDADFLHLPLLTLLKNTDFYITTLPNLYNSVPYPQKYRNPEKLTCQGLSYLIHKNIHKWLENIIHYKWLEAALFR